ncbi:hypothetical protein [Pseudomonas aegrilactucae]|uniref:Uncharacterized protein n=1 Tax=Pseudomonas aegrilactucae TaxID=2854028 RepID=A0A9Q2XP83_9PSED|nr:hypothetical protein [Pseudomonas aegrilactucae]MBV6289945.1 hypothetical protein [Pseudomonas aegrilactucae]
MSVVNMPTIVGSGTFLAGVVVYGLVMLFAPVPTLPEGTPDGLYVQLAEHDARYYALSFYKKQEGERLEQKKSGTYSNIQVLDAMPGVQSLVVEFADARACYGATATLSVGQGVASLAQLQRNPSCELPEWLVEGASFKILPAPRDEDEEPTTATTEAS